MLGNVFGVCALGDGRLASASDDRTVRVWNAATGECVRTIVRERGLAGTMQGLGATIARNVVGVTAYFYVYEMARLQMAGGAPVSRPFCDQCSS